MLIRVIIHAWQWCCCIASIMEAFPLEGLKPFSLLVNIEPKCENAFGLAARYVTTKCTCSCLCNGMNDKNYLLYCPYKRVRNTARDDNIPWSWLRIQITHDTGIYPGLHSNYKGSNVLTISSLTAFACAPPSMRLHNDPLVHTLKYLPMVWQNVWMPANRPSILANQAHKVLDIEASRGDWGWVMTITVIVGLYKGLYYSSKTVRFYPR